MINRFLAEWEEQDGVIVAFPHEDTDWIDYLQEARACVVKIASAIALYEKVYLLCRDKEACQNYFETLENITLVEVDFDDTWMRDCSVLSCEKDEQIIYKGFEFTGWGGKFEAKLDNALNGKLANLSIYEASRYESVDYILEGGAVEGDGKGTLLTTTSCLLNPNRNHPYDKNSVEKVLNKELGSDHFLWLEHGYLAGDDTDGHIDTLARFCDEDTIAYVGLPSKDDEHFEALCQMEKELKAFRKKDGSSYKLVALPFVPPIYYDEERLPATYANFLIINGAVLVPTYGVGEDEEALQIMQNLFPSREIIGIDCQVLIKQHGSLHCMTMQLAQSK